MMRLDKQHIVSRVSSAFGKMMRPRRVAGNNILPLLCYYGKSGRQRETSQALLGACGGPFYLSGFVKKFTYSALAAATVSADNHRTRLSRVFASEFGMGYRGRFLGGAGLWSRPRLGADNDEKKNMNGPGLVIRRQHGVSSVMPAEVNQIMWTVNCP